MAAPVVPLRALIEQLKGTTKLELTVTQNGEPNDIQVIESSGRRILDLSAVVAASKWIFEPALKNGRPVARKIRIPIQFEPAQESELPRLKETHKRLIRKLPDDPVSFFHEEKLFEKLALASRALRPRKIDTAVLILVRADGSIADVGVDKSSGSTEADYLICASIYDFWQIQELRKGRATLEKHFGKEALKAIPEGSGPTSDDRRLIQIRLPLRFSL